MRSVAAGSRPHTIAQKATTDGEPTTGGRPHNLPCTRYQARCIQYDDKSPFSHRPIPPHTSVSTPLPPLTHLHSETTVARAWVATHDSLADRFSTEGLKTRI